MKKQNFFALVKDGVLDGTAADSLKPVDVFYIYPTVTGFRPETEVCDMTDTMMVAGAKMLRQIQTAVFEESCNVFMPYYRQISMPKPGSDYSAIIDYVSKFDATDAPPSLVPIVTISLPTPPACSAPRATTPTTTDFSSTT